MGFVFNKAADAAMSGMKNQAQAEMRGVSSVFKSTSNQLEINWTNFNYPPVLKLIHYDPNELPAEMAADVRMFNRSFLAVFLVCAINFISSIFVHEASVHMLYAFLNLVLFPSVSCMVFYKGYEGIATASPSLMKMFKIAQGILCVLWFVFVFLDAGSFHGVVLLGRANAGQVVVCILESSLWFLCTVLGALSIRRATLFNPYTARGANV